MPLSVRLVKGAYWDTETVHAQAEHWPLPVFEHKPGNRRELRGVAATLHDHHGKIRAAFGSHNLRSIAHTIVSARARDIPDDGYEFQMLYGMAEPIHDAVRSSGSACASTRPVGEFVPGMAYLVRRLLENTANESFVRARLSSRDPPRGLVAAPPIELPSAAAGLAPTD